jgi:ankyrin repeat protein
MKSYLIEEYLTPSESANFDRLTNEQKLCYIIASYKKGGPCGDINISEDIKSLIGNGVNVNYVDEYGKTPLILTIEKRLAHSFFELIKAGATPSKESTEFLNQELCEHIYDMRFSDDPGDYLESLIAYKANVNYIDIYGKTPLELALSKDTQVILPNKAAYLIIHGAKITKAVKSSWSQLVTKSLPVVLEKQLQEEKIQHMTVRQLALFEHFVNTKEISTSNIKVPYLSSIKEFISQNFFKLTGICKSLTVYPQGSEINVGFAPPIISEYLKIGDIKDACPIGETLDFLDNPK